MFERYTERARKTLFYARYEASQLGASSIAPEHVLLGLLQDGQGAVARMLAHRRISAGDLRRAVTDRIARHPPTPTHQEMPFTPAVRLILEGAAAAADRLGQSQIRPEHLLIGVLEVNDAVAAAVLADAGLRSDAAEAEIASYERERMEAAVTLSWETGSSAMTATQDAIARLQREVDDLRARVERLEGHGGGPSDAS